MQPMRERYRKFPEWVHKMSNRGPENRLTLRGPLTVAACEVIHAEFVAADQRGLDIVVDWEADAEVDVAFLQLLISAERSAARAGRAIALGAPPSGALASALRSAGFAPPPGAVALKDIFSLNAGRQP
jgi:ABC-type transporter Mla MlaB component